MSVPVPPVPWVEVHRPGGRSPLLLLCDHAGRLVPDGLDRLGIDESELARHIGWDIGAARVTYGLARLLDAPAVLCHASRLLIDPNRRPWTPTSIPAEVDGTVVPGNRDLSPEEVRRRIRRYWLPYHRTVARAIARFRARGIVPVLIAVHSFTPRLNGGAPRPWHVGVLWRDDDRLAAPVLAALRARGDLVVGDNEPYSGRFHFGYTIEFHAQRTGLPHVMFELRQDLVAEPAGADYHARVLAEALRAPLSRPELYRIRERRCGPAGLDAAGPREGRTSGWRGILRHLRWA